MNGLKERDYCVILLEFIFTCEFINVFFVTFQDLMTKNKRRNWRRLLAGGLIAIVVLALVITVAILLNGSPNSTESKALTAAGISLEEWLGGSLSTKSFNGTWLSGQYFYSFPSILFLWFSAFCSIFLLFLFSNPSSFFSSVSFFLCFSSHSFLLFLSLSSSPSFSFFLVSLSCTLSLSLYLSRFVFLFFQLNCMRRPLS